MSLVYSESIMFSSVINLILKTQTDFESHVYVEQIMLNIFYQSSI